MPESTVWPVSSLKLMSNDGSSRARRPRLTASFSLSALVSGSTATPMTGSGKCTGSRSSGRLVAVMVSPVTARLSPTTATMSPAWAALISSRLLACMRRSHPTRSRRLRLMQRIESPLASTPE